MPSASDSLLAELDPTTQGDIIMRKYRALPWPVLRTTDFRPTSPNFGQSLSSTTVDAPKPKQLTFSDETTFRPISPIQRSPRTSPVRRSASPHRSDTSLTRSSSHRPTKRSVSPTRNTSMLTPPANRTSPGRLSPEVSAISQRIFQSIDEIRKEIQLGSDDVKISSRGRYKHRAERDVSPNKYRAKSPTSPSIRGLSPTRTLKSEASPSTRAFRQDLSLATTRNPRRQPRAEISRIVADVSEPDTSRKRVEFSDSPTRTSNKRASSPLGANGSSSRPTIASGLAVNTKSTASDSNNNIEDIIEGYTVYNFFIFNACFCHC